MTQVRFKLFFNGECRLRTDSAPTVAWLRNQLVEPAAAARLKLTWTDSDGDDITIVDELDLAEAIAAHQDRPIRVTASLGAGAAIFAAAAEPLPSSPRPRVLSPLAQCDATEAAAASGPAPAPTTAGPGGGAARAPATKLRSLRRGSNRETPDKFGPKDLLEAAESGDVSKCKSLIAANADVNYADTRTGCYKLGNTALILAACRGHIDIAALLLQHGAKTKIDLADECGLSALICAAQYNHPKVLKLLLDNNASIEHPDKEGLTALLWAASEGHTKIAEILVTKGANAGHANNDGETALIVASKKGGSARARIATLLLKRGRGVNTEQIDADHGSTALNWAAYNGHIKVVEALLTHDAKVDHASKTGNTALIFASERNHAEVAKILVDHGANKGHTNNAGETAQMLAARCGHVELTELFASATGGGAVGPLAPAKGTADGGDRPIPSPSPNKVQASKLRGIGGEPGSLRRYQADDSEHFDARTGRTQENADAHAQNSAPSQSSASSLDREETAEEVCTGEGIHPEGSDTAEIELVESGGSGGAPRRRVAATDEPDTCSEDDDDFKIDECLLKDFKINECLLKTKQHLLDGGPCVVEDWYNANSAWHEWLPLQELRERLKRDQTIEFSEDDERMYYYQDTTPEEDTASIDVDLDTDTSDDDSDGEDDGNTERIGHRVKDPCELFARVEETVRTAKNAARDGTLNGPDAVEGLIAALESECASENMTQWLHESQHDELVTLCHEARRRAPWLTKPGLLPGDPGFNQHADTTMREALIVDEDFKMHGAKGHFLRCSKCSKMRDVGPGRPYFFMKGQETKEKWSCSSKSSPVTSCDDRGNCDGYNDTSMAPKLQPYQKTVKFLVHPFSPIQRMLVAHRTGSGKTRTMIELLDNFFHDPRPKIVVLPTQSIVLEFIKELLKFPNRYLDFAKAEWQSADHAGQHSNFLEQEFDVQHKHLLSCFKMRKFYRKGTSRPEARVTWVKKNPGSPLPAAPILILSYARAGGAGVQNKTLYEFRIRAEGSGSHDDNPYNDKVVLMDEFHNLSPLMLKPEYKRYLEKFNFLKERLKSAQRATLVGLTATPVRDSERDVKPLMDVIRGPGTCDEGFVSYFGASPPSLFPKVEPEGAPSHSLPHVVEVPLPFPMRAKYLTQKNMYEQRLRDLPSDEKADALDLLLAPYCNTSIYYNRTRLTIRNNGGGGSGVRDGLAPRSMAKLHRIADDIISDWKTDPTNKSIVLIDRTCGWEALFYLLRYKAAASTSLLRPEAIRAYPPLEGVQSGADATHKPPQEQRSGCRQALDSFNAINNTDGKFISVLVVDIKEAAEGVSFKGVRTMYFANVPKSWSDYQQLTGRGVRSFGHNALAPEHRVVCTKMYIGVLPQAAAACAACAASCNVQSNTGGKSDVWHCTGCSQFYCSKQCKENSHISCTAKPKKIPAERLEDIETVDQQRKERLLDKLQRSPPLKSLQAIAVDGKILMEDPEINEDVTCFMKVIRKAKIREAMRKRRKQEARDEAARKAKSEEDLKKEVEALKGLVDKQNRELGQTTKQLKAGECCLCNNGRLCNVIVCNCKNHLGAPTPHQLCVACFEDQFEEACEDTHSVRLDRIYCCAHERGRDPASNQGPSTSWAFSDAVPFLSQGRRDELYKLYWGAKQKLLELAKSELRELLSQKSEIEAASGVKCPDYWVYNRIPQNLDTREQFRKKDVTAQLKDAMQDVITNAMIPQYLGRGRDLKEKSPFRYTRLEVQKVFRVENPFLWLRYQGAALMLRAATSSVPGAESLNPKTSRHCDKLLRHTLRRGNTDASLRSQLNEVYLFHGTSEPVSRLIMQIGFNERFARDGLYGFGNYFAEDSSKSDQYATSSEGKGEFFYMFLARVCMGSHPQRQMAHCNGMKIPNEITPGCGVRHTSVLGLHGNHDEFIVYDGLQAYPEYLVVYKRKP